MGAGGNAGGIGVDLVGFILGVLLIAIALGVFAAIAFAIDAVIRFVMRVLMQVLGLNIRIPRVVSVPSLTVLITIMTLTLLVFAGGRAGAPPPTGLPVPTAAPVPTSAPAATPDAAEIVQLELDKLTLGQVAFNPPSSVKMGDSTRIEARIAQSIVGQATLTGGMRGPGVPQLQDIRVSRFMGAELTGENFDIKALDSATQVVEDTELTQWSWDVKGTRPGRQTLHLRIWARVVAPPASEQTKDLPVMDHDVDVQVNPAYSATQFWENNWQWLLGGGFSASVAAVIWKLAHLLKRPDKRRSQVRPLR